MKFLIAPVFVLCFSALLVSGSYYGGGGGDYGSNQVDAAIMSKSSMRTIPIASEKGSGSKTVVDINGNGGGGNGGLVLRFNSAPGPITAIQKMTGGATVGRVQKQSVVAEPDLLIQDVKKPVIQKVRLQITPMRKVFQEVKPVQEQVETVVAKDEEGGKYGGTPSKYNPPMGYGY